MKKVLFLVIAFLLCSSTAWADLIEKDLFSEGDGLLTFDTDTNLEWLDLTEVRMSMYTYDEILSDAGGWISLGFRYATTSEVCDLVSPFIWDPCPTTGITPTAVIGNQIGPLMLLGDLNSHIDNFGLSGVFEDGGGPRLGDLRVTWFPYDEYNSYLYVNEEVYHPEHATAAGAGSLLVRASIPEPIPEPNIIISPAPYDFGSINTGTTSTPQTFTISNTGDADLTLGTITLTGTDATEFAIQKDLCSAQIIAPAGNCTIDAVFAPTTEGAKSASLSIPSDDPDTPTLDVPLSGVGTPTNGTISGVVLDSSHAPIPDARVKIWHNGVMINETRTDVYGWYSFTGLEDGHYTILSHRWGYNKDTKTAKVKQSRSWAKDVYINLDIE